MMLDLSGQTIRNDPKRERSRTMLVECEICDRIGRIRSDYFGVYICASCQRDIASPHIHD